MLTLICDGAKDCDDGSFQCEFDVCKHPDDYFCADGEETNK